MRPDTARLIRWEVRRLINAGETPETVKRHISILHQVDIDDEFIFESFYKIRYPNVRESSEGTICVVKQEIQHLLQLEYSVRSIKKRVAYFFKVEIDDEFIDSVKEKIVKQTSQQPDQTQKQKPQRWFPWKS